jgi:hypothetical protein
MPKLILAKAPFYKGDLEIYLDDMNRWVEEVTSHVYGLSPLDTGTLDGDNIAGATATEDLPADASLADVIDKINELLANMRDVGQLD